MKPFAILLILAGVGLCLFGIHNLSETPEERDKGNLEYKFRHAAESTSTILPGTSQALVEQLESTNAQLRDGADSFRRELQVAKQERETKAKQFLCGGGLALVLGMICLMSAKGLKQA